MEKRSLGDCCIAGDDVAWRMGRILLRYRPIAPKPLAAGTALGGVTPATVSVSCRAERRRNGTRRQTGLAGGRRGRKSRKSQAAAAAAVVTLPLMPETPERKEGPVVVAPRPVRVVGVSVTVERVSESCDLEICRGMGGNGSGEELKTWLESDDSPAFISDGENHVTWTNAAYRRMVVGGDSPSPSPSSSCQGEAAGEEVVRVALVTRGLLPGETHRAFTCTARVRYVCRRRGMVSLSSPCDVWRLEDGKLAWRLDVKAALSLSSIRA